MPLRPSVCIDAVLENVPLAEALKTVAQAGYGAFEFWKWWDKDLNALCELRDENALAIAACCTKFVSLVDPACRSEYLSGLEESIAVAERLSCPVLISQVGDARPGVLRQAQHASLVEGLQAAAKLLAGTPVVLAIEPLNEIVDHQGYYLVRSDEAFQIVDEVSSRHVKVTFDLYHQQISEGHLIHNVTANIDKIAHFHAAGNPGRHELDRGELYYPGIFEAIRATNYGGYVGLEYWPVDAPEVGLKKTANWFSKG